MPLADDNTVTSSRWGSYAQRCHLQELDVTRIAPGPWYVTGPRSASQIRDADTDGQKLFLPTRFDPNGAIPVPECRPDEAHLMSLAPALYESLLARTEPEHPWASRTVGETILELRDVQERREAAGKPMSLLLRDVTIYLEQAYGAHASGFDEITGTMKEKS